MISSPITHYPSPADDLARYLARMLIERYGAEHPEDLTLPPAPVAPRPAEAQNSAELEDLDL